MFTSPAATDAPTEVWLAKAAVAARRANWGLQDPKVEGFLGEAEVLSIGCFCGSATALQALGLKKASYPLDWTRHSINAIRVCLSTRFANFLTYQQHRKGTSIRNPTCWARSTWGGSFWHHNPDDAETKATFARRIERFLALSQKRLIFVCIVNSANEVNGARSLRDMLVSVFPNSEIYLIVLIDLQEQDVAMQVQGDDRILYFRIRGADLWSERFEMRLCAEQYGQLIAVAIRYWAGVAGASANILCITEDMLSSCCNDFFGGDPSVSMYWPVPSQNVQDVVQGIRADAGSLHGQVASLAPSTIRTVERETPATSFTSGDLVEANYGGTGQFYQATVVSVDGDAVIVEWADGDTGNTQIDNFVANVRPREHELVSPHTNSVAITVKPIAPHNDIPSTMNPEPSTMNPVLAWHKDTQAYFPAFIESTGDGVAVVNWADGDKSCREINDDPKSIIRINDRVIAAYGPVEDGERFPGALLQLREHDAEVLWDDGDASNTTVPWNTIVPNEPI